ncbi:hypothetical protein DL96DRAFT_1820393 [Flagelloscypha sp. PMI_526]|nr:hypothetical protein DL96DRAFT_1820393 [Flagelloscypha sp. PMI_526]
MSAATSPDLATSAATCAFDYPVEIWEQILIRIPKASLWKLRSLNRVAYEVAARIHYGTLSPFREKLTMGMLKRVCYWACSYSQVYSDMDFGKQEKFAVSRGTSNTKKDISEKHRFLRARQELIQRVISHPSLRLKTISIYYDEVILPYTQLIWLGIANTLVHLELQFVHQSACGELLSLSGKVHCPTLQSFVLITGPGTRSPTFYTRVQENPKHLYYRDRSCRWNQPFPTSLDVFLPIFKALQSILPAGLSTLGIHWLFSDGYKRTWVLDPSFFHPEAFPDLKKLHISGLSLDRNPAISQFLFKRAPSLQSLALENIYGTGQLLRRVKVMEELEELRLDSLSYWQLFEPDSFQSGLRSPFIQWYSHLRCLEVQMGSSNSDDAFMLLVELGRGGSSIQELCLSLNPLYFKHLRAGLLLLPRVTKLTFTGVSRCDSLMCRVSSHPVWKQLQDQRSRRPLRFVGLAQAGGRLGPIVRRAMTAELRKSIDRVYAECVSSLKSKEALYSSIKTTLKATEGIVQGTTRPDVPAEDHRKVTLELAESCLLLE